MRKTKFALGLAMVVSLLAVSAGPALAIFENTEGKTTGAAKGGATTFTVNGVGVTCASLTGTYEVRKADTAQGLVNPGEHLGIVVGKFTECSVGKIIPATVSGCTVQVKQVSKEVNTNLPTDALTECVIKVMECEVRTATKTNENLKSASVANSGTNLLIKANVTGITYEATAGCKAMGIVSGKEGGLKSESVTAEHLKAI